MGDKHGFNDTRGTLFFDIERILIEKKPKIILLENVRNLVSHDQGRTFLTIKKRLERIDYKIFFKVLNTLDYGLPQKRERIIIVGFLDKVDFTFPMPLKYRKTLNDILEDDSLIDPSLYASKDIINKRKKKIKGSVPFPSIMHENKSGNISALPYSCALRAGASYNYLLVNGVRRLSPRELLRLQGFPENFNIIGSYAQLRKQTGNAVSVSVIRAVAKEVVKSLFRDTK
jgi:DNA (cytosine-5)-methyltransferase 1